MPPADSDKPDKPVQPEQPAQPDKPVLRDRPGCADARTGMRAFVAGTEPAIPPPPWREHMRACSRCTLEYHELVQNVAHFARGLNPAVTKVAEAYAGPSPEERVRRSLIAANSKQKLKLSKLILPIAVVAMLAVVFSRGGMLHPTLRTLSGAVTRNLSVIDSTEPVTVSRGDACTTTAHSRAQLELGESWIRFAPESSFLVDATDKLAVRFFAGEATVQGDALLILPGCAVEVREGSAEIVLATNQATIRCESGSVSRSDAHGRFLILPGESSNVLFEPAPAPRPTVPTVPPEH